MVDTIEEAMYPVSIVSFLFGCGILIQPLYKSRPYLNFLYSLSVWSVYVYIFCYAVNIWPVFASFPGCLRIMMNPFVTITYMIFNMRKHKNVCTCIRKLDLVDNTLEKLGTPKEYHKLRNFVKRILITWFTIVFMTYIIDSFWWTEVQKDRRAIVLPFVVNYFFYVNSFMSVLFMILLSCIGTRFDKLNEHIRRLAETEGCGLRGNWKKSPVVTRCQVGNTESSKHILWITIHLHSELCRIARDINSLFEIQLTIEMMSYFIIIIMMCCTEYNMLLCFTQSGDFLVLRLALCTNIRLILHLTRFMLINHICQSVSTKAQETRTIIHKLTNLIRFANMREVIIQFILQISLQPLQFTGMGMFCFGYSFIRKFLSWIVSSVIFLIQMNTRSEMRTQFCGRNNATISKNQ